MLNQGMYATYFEIVAGDPDQWTQRWQWVVMPKHPDQIAYWVFHRHQRNPSAKPHWSVQSYGTPESLSPSISEHLDLGRATNRQHTLREPIVVLLSRDQVNDIIGDMSRPKTPWAVLNSVKTISRRLGWKL